MLSGIAGYFILASYHCEGAGPPWPGELSSWIAGMASNGTLRFFNPPDKSLANISTLYRYARGSDPTAASMASARARSISRIPAKNCVSCAGGRALILVSADSRDGSKNRQEFGDHPDRARLLHQYLGAFFQRGREIRVSQRTESCINITVNHYRGTKLVRMIDGQACRE